MYLNKVIIIGNLTRDPELKALPSGIKVASFSLATNRVWRDKDGAKQEAADYHNVVVFGKQAETVAQYMKKGSSLLVEGRLQTRSWEDKTSGKKLYKTEIVADRTQFGPKGKATGGPAETGQAGGDQDDNQDGNQAGAGVDSKGKLDEEFPDDTIDPADIPF